MLEPKSGGHDIGEVEIDKRAKNLLDSCNGLLLFRKPSTCQYQVCNPSTKESVTIPYSCDSYCDAALAFDPCKSIHFKCDYSDFSIWLLEDHNQADGWILKYSISYGNLWECLVVDQFRLQDEVFWFQPYAVHPKSDVIFLGTTRSIISWHIKSNQFKLVYKTRDGMVVPGCYTPVLTYSRCLVPLKSLGMRNFRSNQLKVALLLFFCL
ncbi:hypothetical protein SO802_008689 [Lithocarpus litseifolius]|uniref:Uncharacterized protein n=1 Tax=Lithocarpus litseifolius TaxID=425828 RepID=A0AAW2DBI0_9ROSI